MNATVALVLAAGAGTRMKSRIPKVLHPIAGQSMLFHAIEAASQVCEAVVTVIGEESTLVQTEVSHIASKIDTPLYVAYQKKQLGTADAAAQGVAGAMEAQLNPAHFLITYGDVPLLHTETLADLIAAHHASEATVTVATFINSNPHGYGRIVRTPEGHVQKIVEQKEASTLEKLITEVNSGVYVVDAPFLVQSLPMISDKNTVAEKYLTDIVELAAQAGRVVTGHIISDGSQLTGCNNQHELLNARKEFNRRVINKHLHNGVRIDDPSSTWIDNDVVIESDATILPNTNIFGASHIHSHAVIGPDSGIENSTIGSGSSVRRSEVHDSSIGHNCTIGPFSYVRPGTHLSDDVKVGAYVETKNIHVGQGTKIPHLSYVGDATIGQHTNIGAGTIVVNYDGVDKHRSNIGDHVRIGSNSSIVSPVNIADGVYTGADSVVTHDVPAGALAVSQGNKQRNILDWVFRKRKGSSSAQAAHNHQPLNTHNDVSIQTGEIPE